MLLGIQYLRALAAIGVMLVHFVPELMGGLPANDFHVRVFGIGTDVLLVIAGFFAWRTTATTSKAPLSWWIGRMVRLVPMYWLTLGVFLLIRLLRPAPLPYLSDIINGFLFIPSRGKDVAPFFIPGWAMNLIFAFTMIFTCCLHIRRSRARLVALAALMAGLIALRPLVDRSSPVLFVYTSPLLLEFLVGVFIAVFYLKVPRRSWASVLGLIAICLGVLYAVHVSPHLFPNGPRSVRNGVPAALFVFGVIQFEPLLQRLSCCKFLKIIGDSSYAIYLSHPLIVVPVALGVEGFEFHAFPLNVSLGIAVMLGVGILVSRYVETPLITGTRRLINPLIGERSWARFDKPDLFAASNLAMPTRLLEP